MSAVPSRAVYAPVPEQEQGKDFTVTLRGGVSYDSNLFGADAGATDSMIATFAPKLSLGTTFVACQLLDVFFSLFVLTGVEKMRIVPGFTQTNAYDLYYVPITHSLVGALAWSVAAGIVLYSVRRSLVEALVVALVVFSHFVLDVPVHTPDLPLATEAGAKLGFGLWQNWKATVALELVVFGAGALSYAKTRPLEGKAKTERSVFFAVMTLLTIATPFLPTAPARCFISKYVVRLSRFVTALTAFDTTPLSPAAPAAVPVGAAAASFAFS